MSPVRPARRTAGVAGMTVALLASSALASAPLAQAGVAVDPAEEAAGEPTYDAVDFEAAIDAGAPQEASVEEGAAPMPWEIAEAREGFVTVGIAGTYDTTGAQALLDRINQIRAEAAAEGIAIDGVPVSGTPLQWSSELERAAQVRAAEASFAFSHERPNGTGTVYGKDGNAFCIEVLDENLAWYPSTEAALESWYAEKDAYLAFLETGVDTGDFARYCTLISDDYAYVGLGSFALESTYSTGAAGDTTPASEEDAAEITALEGSPEGLVVEDQTIVPGTGSVPGTMAEGTTTLVALFSATPALDETAQPLPDGPTVVPIDVFAPDYLRGEITGDDLVYVGATSQLAASVWSQSPDGLIHDNIANGLALTWSSSDDAVATVDPTGLVTGVAPGSATVTVACEGVELASLEIAVEVAPPVPVGVNAPAAVSVPSGTAPELPATVEVAMSDGTLVDLPVVWGEVAPEQYAPLAGGSFEVLGTVEGIVDPVAIQVDVEPAAPVEAAAEAQVAVEAGAPVELPGTATVTWSNGATTQEPVTWEAVDPSALVPGASVEVHGTAGDAALPVVCTIAVAQAVPTAAADPAPATCFVGEAPELPATVAVTLSDGSTQELPVVWDAVDPSAYAAPGEFAVAGTVEGTDLTVNCTVMVESIAVVSVASPAPVATPSGTAPELPATVTATLSDGTVEELPVTWDAVDPSAYGAREGGSFEVSGTVAGWDDPVALPVTVEAAAAVSASAAPVATQTAVTPALPATAEVTWSNGDVTEAPVVWDAVDPSAYAAPGEFAVAGTVEGTDLMVNCTVMVDAAVVTAVADPAPVATPSGTAPALPPTVEATLSNGTSEKLPATWDAVDPSAYSAREGGSFEVSGTVEGWDAPVAVQVTVEPASMVSAAEPAPVGTEAGTAPVLPATAEVTWSNGDATQEPIAWDAVDPSQYLNGGSFTVAGVVGDPDGQNLTVDATVTVAAAYVAAVADPAPVSTASGTAPVLPATVEATWSNGVVEELPATWGTVDPSAYSAREGGSFEVAGTVAGWDEPVTAVVDVEPAAALSASVPDVATEVGIDPELPSVAEVTWSNGDVSQEAVTWDALPADALAVAGSFVATGSVDNVPAAEGTAPQVSCTVTVAEPTVVSVSAPDPVATPSGTAPELPPAVEAAMSNGTTRELAVTWGTVDPSAYGAREGGSFEVAGSAEDWPEPVAVQVTVEPAAIAAVADPAPVATVEGLLPALPATVDVTWSNGDASQEAVTWGAVDPQEVVPGELTVQGSVEGWETPVACTVTVAAKTAVSAADPDPATTPSGTAPELPATVTVTWDNQTASDEPVEWDEVDPAAYSALEGGSFTVEGIVQGAGLPVQATVTVEPAVATQAASAAASTPAGIAPELPASTSVVWSNGDTTDEAIEWAPLDPSSYAAVGSFSIAGTFANEAARAVEPVADVTVTAPVIVGFAENPDVATTAGVRPQLPATVPVVMSDGTQVEVPVAWQEIPARAFYAAGAFTVAGTVENYSEPVEITVVVDEPAVTWIQSLNVTTTAGQPPALPKTVRFMWDNGSSTNETVAWDAVDPQSYAEPGSFTVTGTAAGREVSATVTVNAPVTRPDIVPTGDETLGTAAVAAGAAAGLGALVTSVRLFARRRLGR